MGGGPSAPPAPADPNIAAEAEKKKARAMAAIVSRYEGRLGTGSTALAGTDRKALANIGVETPAFARNNPVDSAVLDNSATGKAVAGGITSGTGFSSGPPAGTDTGATGTPTLAAQGAEAAPATSSDVSNAQNQYNRSLAYWAMKRKGKVV